MTGAHTRGLLRFTAIAIAAAACLDPSFASRGVLRVAVVDSATDAGLSAAVRKALEPVFDVTSRPDGTADAWVIVADDADAPVPALPADAAVSLVTPDVPAREVRLEQLDAPRRVSRHARVTLAATFASRGMAALTSQLAVRAGGLELARVEHRWASSAERFTARFDVVAPSTGVNHLVVDAVDVASRGPASRGDALVVVDDERVPVLVFEGRPSWNSTFIRRALERDGRFAVTLLSRVSRGVAATASPAAEVGSPPMASRLGAPLLNRAAVVIAGAPDALTANDVTALREFVERRGGALVLAPDRRVTGPALGLLGNRAFEERVLEAPIPIALAAAPELRVLASELLELRGLAQGVASTGPVATALAASAEGRSSGSSLWSMPAGSGQIVFVGTLDAWRFRGRPQDAFDRAWPQLVEWLAASVPAPLSASFDRDVVEPLATTTLRVRTRAAADGATVSVSASIAPVARTAGQGEGRVAPVRLWPGHEPGTFTATLTAPVAAGIHVVSVGVDSAGEPSTRALARAWLIVAPQVRQAKPSDDRWRAVTRARRGVAVTTSDVGTLVTSLRQLVPGANEGPRVGAMRSAWWMLPFAACLGAEWWLRRRAGLR